MGINCIVVSDPLHEDMQRIGKNNVFPKSLSAIGDENIRKIQHGEERVHYFITNKNYGIFELNAALYKYRQPILGE